MAHEIATINGQQAFAYLDTPAWHRLGQRLAAAAAYDLDTALNLASLDWTVSARPLTYAAPAGPLPVASHQVIARDTDDQVLGVVTRRYQPIQHTEAFGLFRPLLESQQLRINCAGALGKGERVWMLCERTAQEQTVATLPGGKADVVKPYLWISTGHDGAHALEIVSTSVRVVCANTWRAAASSDLAQPHIRITHHGDTAKATAAVGDAVAALGSLWQAETTLYARMAQATITPAMLQQYVSDVIEIPTAPSLPADPATWTTAQETRQRTWIRAVETAERQRAAAHELAIVGKGNAGETLWHAFNAITEMIDHTAKRATPHASQSAALSAIDGPGDSLKSLALARAREMVYA